MAWRCAYGLDIILELIYVTFPLRELCHFLTSDSVKVYRQWVLCDTKPQMGQLMRLWYLSHRRPAKAQASLRIHAVSPEPSLFAHMKYGSRRRDRPKIRHLAPLDGCACAFEGDHNAKRTEKTQEQRERQDST